MGMMINEVYFGKTPQLQAIEKQFNKFRRKYTENIFGDIDINSDKDLIKFNRMIEDYFGFGCFSLTINASPLKGACTIPISYRIDVVKNNTKLIADKSGFKFKKNADFAGVAMMTSGLLADTSYSDSELIALILHEIGHNFYTCIAGEPTGLLCAVYTMANIINTIFTITNEEASRQTKQLGYTQLARLSLASTEYGMKIYTKVEKYINQNLEFVSALVYAMRMIGSMVNIIGSFGMWFANFITLGFSMYKNFAIKALKMKINPLSLIPIGLKYDDERMADNFVSIYGYGAELSSALRKLDSNDITGNPLTDKYRNIPIIGHIYNSNLFISTYMITILDEHPLSVSRIQDQINLLETELAKSDLDPKMRKYIESDIKICRKEIEKSIEIRNATEDTELLKKVYYGILSKFTKNKDIKDFLLDHSNRSSRFDTAYANARK